MNREETIKRLIQCFGGEEILSSDLPSGAQLYYLGRDAYLKNDLKTAKIYENLIHILHNSHIPVTTDIGKGFIAAYGGIGILVHGNAKIGDYVTLGTNVTLGAAPRIHDHSYISTGARILRCVDIGPFSIVGANAVIKKPVPPLTIYAGVPGKEIGKIDEANLENYIEYFVAGMKRDPVFVDMVRKKIIDMLSENKH